MIMMIMKKMKMMGVPSLIKTVRFLRVINLMLKRKIMRIYVN